MPSDRLSGFEEHAIDLCRASRQDLATLRYLGVDFIPLGSPPSAFATPARPVVAGPVQTAASVEIQGDKALLLRDLQERHDRLCPHCTNATYHTQTVFGEGDPNARLMFIGEAPGEEEDRTGRPFVGRAGQKLDEIIQAMRFRRDQVYIANVLKSRPPENRTPLPPEVAACSPFLAEQIRIIRPAVIVALGKPAAQFLLASREGIMRLRGRWACYADGEVVIPVMPTFHPAYLLRNYTVETRQQMWSDMQAVLARLASEMP
jgi:DNA polymerase